MRKQVPKGVKTKMTKEYINHKALELIEQEINDVFEYLDDAEECKKAITRVASIIQFANSLKKDIKAEKSGKEDA